MKTVLAKFRPLAGHKEKLQAILEPVAEASRLEAGVMEYRLFADQANDELVTLEVYKDDAAFEAHLVTSHVQEAIAQIYGVLDGDIAITQLKPV